ncbi:MAG: PilW family protein, partial [Microcystaceae cyanobacterium]
MVNLLLNWIIKIKSSSNRFRSSKGFTLMELLIAASLTLIVVGGAGWALVTMLTFNKSDKTTAEVESNYNRALAFIVEELKSSKEIYDDGNLAADVNNNDIAPSFPKEAWKIPILAFQAADNIKGRDEYTVYYLVDKNHPNTPDSAKVWAGDYVLYRWGPPYNDDGQYSPDNTNPDEIKAASTWQGAA